MAKKKQYHTVDNLEVQVSETVFDLVKDGQLQMILANLDPGADKAIQEGASPQTVTLKARGTRKRGIIYPVQFCDAVLKGYTIQTKKGTPIQQAVRRTARIFLADPLPTANSQPTAENEIPPE